MDGSGNPNAKGGWIWKGYYGDSNSRFFSNGVEVRTFQKVCRQGSDITVLVDIDTQTVSFMVDGFHLGKMLMLTRQGPGQPFTDLCSIMSIYYQGTQVSLVEC